MPENNNVVTLNSKRPPSRYSAHFDLYPDGQLGICFDGIGNPPSVGVMKTLLASLKQAEQLLEESIAKGEEDA